MKVTAVGKYDVIDLKPEALLLKKERLAQNGTALPDVLGISDVNSQNFEPQAVTPLACDPNLSIKGHLMGSPYDQKLHLLLKNRRIHEVTIDVKTYTKLYPNKAKVYFMKKPFTKTDPHFTNIRHHNNTNPNINVDAEHQQDYQDFLADKIKSNADKAEEYRLRNVRRSKTVVKDIIECNGFDLFCLFTFDPKLHDVTDHELIKRIMKNWLHSQQKTWGKMQYVAVPELTKQGNLHFHILLHNFKGRLMDSGHKDKKGRIVYNFIGFHAGIIANATKIESLDNSARYLTKYLSKDMQTVSNSKRYWRSKGLSKPKIVYNLEPILSPPQTYKTYSHPLYSCLELSLTPKQHSDFEQFYRTAFVASTFT